MPYQSYVQEAANNSLSRRNSRIELEDNLKTAASGRKLNEAQAESSLINAGANAQNANTNAASLGIQAQELALRERGQRMDYSVAQQNLRQASEEMLLTDDRTRDIAGMEVASRNADRSVDIKRLGLDERRITNEERKLPMELEGLQLQNDAQKLTYISSKLKVDMEQAMQEGNMKRVAQIFALQDAAMSSQMQGFRAEESLHKWSFIGKWASGIDDALGKGNSEMAQSLHNAMMREAEDIGLDFSQMPMMQTLPNNASKQQWGMLRDIALNSVDFQRDVVKANMTAGGSALDNYIKVLNYNRNLEKDNIAADKAEFERVGDMRATAGPIIASALQAEINKSGMAMTDQDIAETGSYNSVVDTVTDMAFEKGLTGREFTSFATEFSNNITFVTPWGGDTYATQRMGVLPAPGDSNTLGFLDPEDEMEAVIDDTDFKTKIIPSYETFIKSFGQNPQVSNAAMAALSKLKVALTGQQRAKIHEAFIHTLTGYQSLP